MKILFTRQIAVTRGAILAALVLPVFAAQPAGAHEYEALIVAKKYAEAERAITARLTLDANNANALIAKTELILTEGKESRLDEGAKIAELCIANNPKNSECHEALGNVLGTKAQKNGIMSAIGYAGKIRDSFKKAVELDAKNLSARSALMQFYLQTPSFVGGGTSKAKDLIAETMKVNIVSATLLQASLDLKEGNLARAASGALAINVGDIPALKRQQRNILSNIGYAYSNEKKFVEAEKVFKEIVQRFPDSAMGNYGLGRVQQEQGREKEALAHFEKSLGIDASASIFYRLGETWRALGDNAKAIDAFEKALSFKPELSKKMRSEAEDQLKILK